MGKTKRYPRFVAVISLIFFTLIFSLDFFGQKKQNMSDCGISHYFKQLGEYKTDRTRVFAYSSSTNDIKIITVYCRVKKSYNDNRALKIYLFDNKETIPDISKKKYLPEEYKKYLIATYFFNPITEKEELKFCNNKN